MKGIIKTFRVFALLSALVAGAFAFSGSWYWAGGIACVAVLTVMLADTLRFHERRGK